MFVCVFSAETDPSSVAWNGQRCWQRCVDRNLSPPPLLRPEKTQYVSQNGLGVCVCVCFFSVLIRLFFFAKRVGYISPIYADGLLYATRWRQISWSAELSVGVSE